MGEEKIKCKECGGIMFCQNGGTVVCQGCGLACEEHELEDGQIITDLVK